MQLDIPLKEAQEQIFAVINRVLGQGRDRGLASGYVLKSDRGAEICFEYVDPDGDKFEIYARFGRRIGREAFTIDTTDRAGWFEPVPEGEAATHSSSYRLRSDCDQAIMRAFFKTYNDLIG